MAGLNGKLLDSSGVNADPQRFKKSSPELSRSHDSCQSSQTSEMLDGLHIVILSTFISLGPILA
jgi:hypothetical protein